MPVQNPVTPLPSPPSSAVRWRPVDALAVGDNVVEIDTGRRGEVTGKGRLDDLRRDAGVATEGHDDPGVAVKWDDGTFGPYEHARHLVDEATAEAWAEQTGQPFMLFFGVVRVALVPA